MKHILGILLLIFILTAVGVAAQRMWPRWDAAPVGVGAQTNQSEVTLYLARAFDTMTYHHKREESRYRKVADLFVSIRRLNDQDYLPPETLYALFVQETQTRGWHVTQPFPSGSENAQELYDWLLTHHPHITWVRQTLTQIRKDTPTLEALQMACASQYQRIMSLGQDVSIRPELLDFQACLSQWYTAIGEVSETYDIIAQSLARFEKRGLPAP